LEITANNRTMKRRDGHEAELRAILDLLPQMAIVFTQDIVMEHANRHFYSYTGWPDGQRVEPSEWSHLIHPDDLPSARAAGADLRSGTATTEYEVRLRRHDNTYRWHLSRAERVLGPDGGTLRWISMLTDIDEQKTAQAAADRRAQAWGHVSELLQRSLLLRPAANHLPGLTLWRHYEAAAVREEVLVGGDFHDTVRLGPDRVALVVGDVMGKGLAAALGTAEVKFTLRAFLREDADPASALARLNMHLLARREWDDNTPVLLDPTDTETPPRSPHAILCITVIVLNTKTGAARVAVAGMEPPLHVSAARSVVSPIPTGGLPLGVLTDWKPDGVTECLVEPYDVLVLFTDGLTEARQRGVGTSLELLGHDRLLAAIRTALAEQTPPLLPSLKALGQRIVAAAHSFAGAPLTDDVCLLLAARDSS
jgi:PAS domain S-box-containing protein